jgi:alanine racemase
VTIAPVVKANAYGHGALEVGRTLCRQGAEWLAVSTVEEGVQLRDAGIRARILVMGGVLRWERQAIVEHHLTPVIHSLEELREFSPPVYHLKIDSGMHRLGVLAATAEIIAAVREARLSFLEGLMTHLASPEDFSSSETEQQMTRFGRICNALQTAELAPRFIHAASTNAIACRRLAPWENMVRPGLSIYGYSNPARGVPQLDCLAVKPVLTWRASVILVKELPGNALVGYGGTYRCARPTRVAIAGVGYADGLSHRLSNCGHVIVHGTYAPIIGRVSMDLTTIDVTGSPHVQPGDAVTILGEEANCRQDARDLAMQIGSIPYSVLCGIASRVRRTYVDSFGTDPKPEP